MMKLAEMLVSIREKKGVDHIIVIAVHHHPFDITGTNPPCTCKHHWWHCLKDGNELMNTLNGKADVLLFGHEHHWYQWSDCFGIPLVVMCDKSTRRKNLWACLIELEGGKPVSRQVEL